MPSPKEEIYTIEDIYDLRERERAELIDGRMYMMVPPNRIHQRLSHQLERKIGNYIEFQRRIM